jgi:aspartyl-tRNA(Asn)/glutamyl-tRNA(Gln) amidotransferase subunit C
MALTREEVLHIAHLARIAVADSEVEKFRNQLSDILTHFETLQAVDTEAVEPTSHPFPMHSVMRDDESAASLSTSDVLANAPLAEAGLFRVRAVLE